MLLGDGAIERGSVIVSRDRHVELEFRHGDRVLSVAYENCRRGLIVSWRRTGAVED